MRRPHLSIAALIACLAAAVSAGTVPSLEQRLREEEARLARLQAELAGIDRQKPTTPSDEVRGAGTSTDSGEKGKLASTGHADGREPRPLGPRHSNAEAILRRPSIPAADLLYRLGRLKEARAVYEAVLKDEKLAKDDRIWAALQAGSCCRRLGDPDAAMEHYQALMADYPDDPWCTGHVAWALRSAQWEKRWTRLETKAASGSGILPETQAGSLSHGADQSGE